MKRVKGFSGFGGTTGVASFCTGFTLAEVLITLGIIGIVAAMTIPTLISNYKKKEYSVRLKRFYSTMQQAIELSELENASSSTWDFPKNAPASEALEGWWLTYLAPYFKTVVKASRYANTYYEIYFQDGTRLYLTSSGYLEMYYDLAPKEKSVGGKNRFWFVMDRSSGKFKPYDWAGAEIGQMNNTLKPEVPFTTNMEDRNNVMRLCKAQSAYCAQLLFLDNWEFKEDYPFKL